MQSSRDMQPKDFRYESFPFLSLFSILGQPNILVNDKLKRRRMQEKRKKIHQEEVFLGEAFVLIILHHVILCFLLH